MGFMWVASCFSWFCMELYVLCGFKNPNPKPLFMVLYGFVKVRGVSAVSSYFEAVSYV